MPHFIDIHTHRQSTDAHVLIVRNGFMHRFKRQKPTYLVSNGIHPWFIAQKDANIMFLKEIIVENGSIAIGEFGLDRLHPNFEQQLLLCKAQLKLADEMNLPCIIHCVKAYSDFYPLLLNHHCPVIFHGFRGNLDQTERLLKFPSVRFSFGVTLLDPIDKVKQSLMRLPIERIYLETDQTSATIQAIYKVAADLNSIAVQSLKAAIQNNFERDFGVTLT